MTPEIINNIIQYENGNLSEEEEVKFFQELINTGMAWELQGHYGRVAEHLIKEGVCSEQQQ